MKDRFVCLEMGGTHLRLGVVEADFSVFHFEKRPTRLLAEAPDKIACLAGLLRPLVALAGGERVRAVSLSLASLMDRERRMVYSSPMVQGFDNLPLAQGLEEELGLPVVMEKDVNLLLLYEVHRHGLPREGIVAGVFLGTGLGNAICVDGKVYRGFSGAACELGHIPVPGLAQPCGCGKPGCIELKACGRLLEELAARLSCPLEELFVRHGSHAQVKDILYHFAIAIAIEVTILDPAMVLLGGGVADMPGFPLQALQDMVRENVRAPYPREALRFGRPSGDSQAGIVGAAMHAAQVLS